MQITRQFYRGRRWHVAHDPTSNQFYRLSPVAYDFISSLDGKVTVDVAWQRSLTRHGDAAPTQNEVLELIGQLYSSNLLTVDATPEVEQLLGRGRERVKKRVLSQAVSIMYFKLRLFNPDAILTALEPIARPMLTRWGFVAWLVLIISALISLIPKWDRIVSGIDSVTAPESWFWVLSTYVALKLWHETGHGLICKRFGGQVPELGAMLLVLIPSPYVDASAAWSFGNKWHRIAVGAGGMMFELFAAAIAAFVWLNTSSGLLINQLAYFVMVTSSVTTVLFNANPLMKFDGYYMLSDWLEIPNLMQRSGNFVRSLVQKHILRLENVRPVTNQPAEAVILFIYGILSTIYRLLVFFSILTWLMGQWFGIGLVLAVWSFAAWFLIPAGTLIHWLAASPQLNEKRGRTIAAVLALVVIVVGLAGLVPLPDWRRATGVVEATSRRGVYTATDGFVAVTHVRSGQSVKAGDPIITLENPDLKARRMLAVAEADDLRVRLRETRQQQEPAAQQIIQRQLDVALATIADFDAREQDLVVRAPIDGLVVTGDPSRLGGMFLKRGQPICEVLNPAGLRVHAVFNQADASWMNELSRDRFHVELRRVSDLGTVLTGGSATIMPAGNRLLPHGALGFGGGGSFETAERDQSGRAAKADRFSVLIEPEGANLTGAFPGERVYLRFTLPSRPLLSQAVDRVRKALQGRVNL